MKKIKFLFAIALLFCFANTSYAYELYKIESGSNHFAELQIYSEGESFEYTPGEVITPIASFTSEQKNSMIQAAKMWADTIKLNDNDYATYSTYIYDDSDHPNAGVITYAIQVAADTMMTEVNAVLLNKDHWPSGATTDGSIQIGATMMSSSVNYVKPTPLHHGANADLTTIMYHELAHSLGVDSRVEVYNAAVARDYPKTFGKVLMTWEKYLRVYNTAEGEEGMEISAEANLPIGTQFNNNCAFDLTKYAPYFVGDKTIKVLAGDRDGSKTTSEYQAIIKKAGGLVNYSNNYYPGAELSSANRICYGLPILPGDNITEKGSINLAHIELRNSLMSHQFYRNWKTFMEAELAAMVDIGYDIDLRNFFGKSYYLNGDGKTEIFNYNGYYKSNGDGIYDTTKPNDAEYGIGVHIYGDNNKITQMSNILSKGAGSVGARIEGINNTYNLAGESKINMTGSDSIGIAATWGTGHKINIDKNSSVKSTGADGIAISLDFGDNILGVGYETQGSYIYNAFGVDKDPSIKELNGELVKELNINGTVEGTKASIYMSHNAYVENININEGSTIQGDIISEWNSIQTYDNVKVQTGGEIKYTNLNFKNYNRDFENNITGSSVNNTIKMNVAGNLGLKNSVVDVRSLKNDGVINIKGLSGLFTSDSTNSVTGEGTINVQHAATLALGSSVQNIQNTMNINGGSLNLINNVANDININKMNINSDMTLGIDIDLATLKADNLVFQNDSDLTVNDDITVYTSINNTNTILTGNNIEIPFVNNQLKNTNLLGNIYEASSNVTNITTPIYKYQINYTEHENMGNFVLMHADGYDSFNPAIAASSVAQQGMYLTQLNSYEQAFANLDMTMLMTKEQRAAWRNKNKYAATDGGGAITYNPNQFPEEDKGVWFRPFASFENVNLHDGPKADNISYGGLVGGDSDLMTLKLPLLGAVDMIWGAYAGYNGSHQNYQGNSIYQNGGTLGLNASFYWKDFFLGMTANIGATGAEATTMYGREDFAMMAGGIAGKMGYNWDLLNGKFIIQPSLLMSSTLVGTFDYTNAAGVRMHDCSPLVAGQIAPGIKLIGNLKNGWQPYANVQMMWNIMDKTKFKANDAHLTEMAVDPYVQYGVGVQKSWGEKFTGFGQVMMRNGGRNGVSLQAGFRYALGDNNIKNTSKASVKTNDEQQRKIKLSVK